ncbi:MAG TPA: RDD family protein [Candidatus Limnocylindria bacterium]|nr:RDD family protein [Candidatus Limnocylindria bacterium]
MAVVTSSATTEKIGFLIRTVALIIDFIILGIVGSILNAILFGGDAVRGNGLSTLIGLAYYLYFWSSYGHGQTIGNRALSIRVVKTTGSELTLVDAFIRYVGLILSFLCLFIGVIWVAFDANKQGWHDKIASTYVVKA